MDSMNVDMENINKEDEVNTSNIEEFEKEKGDAFLEKWVNLIIQNTEQHWKSWIRHEEKAYRKLESDSFHKQLFYQHKLTAEKNIEALKKYKEDIAKVLKASLQRIYESYRHEEEEDAIEWFKKRIGLTLIEKAYVKNLWLGNDIFEIAFVEEKGLWSPCKPNFARWKDENGQLYKDVVRALEQGLSIDELITSFGLKIVEVYVNAGWV